jgi:hypothetical protein
MAEVTRRVFLENGAGGAVAGIALATGLATATSSRRGGSMMPGAAGSGPPDQEPGSGTYVVHVRDARRGEVSVMTGEREVLLHDPALVARVVAAANGR